MSGAQTSSFYPVNQLLADNATQIQNYYAPQRNQLLIQEAQQRVGANEIEYAARAAAGLLSLNDEAAMSAAYPGVVQDAQRYGFLKNAPAEFPGKARLQQIAAMGVSAKDQYEQQGVTGDYNAWVARQNAARGGGAGTGGTTAAPAAPSGGGGFTGDREQDRALIVKQESGGNPTALNYVARNDPTAYARGATASGKYQFVNSTWREGMQLAGLDPAQYPTAREAPEAVQDKVFDAVYAKYGSKPWQKGPQDWVRDEQGNYQLVTVRPPAGSPGGAPAGTPPPPPAPYQTASLTPTPPPTGATPAAPAQPAATTTTSGATPAQPAPAATTAAAVAAVPAPPPRMANGLTADQNGTLQQLMAIRPRNRAEFDALQQKVATAEQTFREKNAAEERQYRLDVDKAQKDAEAAARAQEELGFKRSGEVRAQAEEIRKQDDAKRQAMFQGATPGMMWNADHTSLVPIPGYTGATDKERIKYNLEHGDPNSDDYASDYAAMKWQMSQQGNVIENDMSMFRPPARPIQRPTYLPQPSPQALEDVRKVVVDSQKNVQNIDHYIDVLKSTDGVTLSTYFNNPRDPKAQALLGAFTALKMTMRGPSAMNTGVLQPHEQVMLKDDLVSPETIRALGGTVPAIEARLHEIKLALLRNADIENRSVGNHGVIMHSPSEVAQLPSGTRFYDTDGNLRIKP